VKISELVNKNSLRRLLKGQVAITQEAVNASLAKRPPAPGVKKARVEFGDGVIKFFSEGDFGEVSFTFEAGARLKEVRLNLDEQVIILAPSGPVKFKTPYHDLQMHASDGPDAARELKVLSMLIPREFKAGLEFRDEAVRIELHKIGVVKKEIERRLKKLPWPLRKIAERMEIKCVSVEPGVMRIKAGRYFRGN